MYAELGHIFIYGWVALHVSTYKRNNGNRDLKANPKDFNSNDQKERNRLSSRVENFESRSPIHIRPNAGI